MTFLCGIHCAQYRRSPCSFLHRRVAAEMIQLSTLRTHLSHIISESLDSCDLQVMHMKLHNVPSAQVQCIATLIPVQIAKAYYEWKFHSLITTADRTFGKIS